MTWNQILNTPLSEIRSELNQLNEEKGGKKMETQENFTSIKDSALAYEPAKTKNIVDLDEVPVDVPIFEDSFEVTNEDNKKEVVHQKVIYKDEEKYRVPNSVLEQLKAHLEENPEMKKFKVKKTGEGLKTRYTVFEVKE